MSIQFAVGKIESVIDEFIEMKKKSFDADLKRTMRDIAFSDWDDTSQVVSLYRVTDMEGHKAAISAAQYLTKHWEHHDVVPLASIGSQGSGYQEGAVRSMFSTLAGMSFVGKGDDKKSKKKDEVLDSSSATDQEFT